MAKTLKELQDEATEKGITFDKRWGVKKISKKIRNSVASKKECHAIDSSEIVDSPDVVEVPAQVDNEQFPLFAERNKEIVEDEPVVEIESEDDSENGAVKIKNISPNRYEIKSFIIKSSEVVELTDDQMMDTYLMKRINRHIELKKFKLVK